MLLFNLALIILVFLIIKILIIQNYKKNIIKDTFVNNSILNSNNPILNSNNSILNSNNPILNLNNPILNLNNDLIIFNNFYNIDTFNKIKNYCDPLRFKEDSRISSRKTLCLSQNKHKSLYDLIYNQQLINYIKNLTNKNLITPTFPIEYRIYPENSSGMRMHKDIALYDGIYYECVLTLENKSDSDFIYKDNNNDNNNNNNNDNNNNDLKSMKTKANTLVLVTPNSILHGVTKLNYGYRKILKFIVMFNNNKPTILYSRNLNMCPF
jgi:hypothetical protein